jgi:hypothetical protein
VLPGTNSSINEAVRLEGGQAADRVGHVVQTRFMFPLEAEGLEQFVPSCFTA